MKAKITIKTDKTKEIAKSLYDLGKKHVLVGIPEANNNPTSDRPGNAALAYLHERGSPAQRIPPRAFLAPSLDANKEKIAKLLKDGLLHALDGDQIATNASIDKTGLFGQQAAQKWFVDPQNNWAPNAPLTIKLKGSDKPLIDTAEMRKSITYVVKT